MICKECAFEADVRKSMPKENAEYYLKRPSFKNRGHKACKGCDCHHKEITPAHE